MSNSTGVLFWMVRKINVCLLLFFAYSTVLAQNETQPYTLTDSIGNFSVVFPGKPVAQHVVDSTNGMLLMSRRYMYEVSASEAYMVSFSDYDPAMIPVKPNDMILDLQREIMRSIRADLPELQEETAVSGISGYKMKANNGQLFMVHKAILVGNRVYQISGVKSGAYPDGAVLDTLFGSFQLLEREFSKRDVPAQPARLFFDVPGGDQDHFTILFPGEAGYHSSEVETRTGKVTMHTLTFMTSETETYAVSYTDYPQGSIKKEDIPTILRNGQSRVLAMFMIPKTTESERIDEQGIPGIFFKANNGEVFVVYKVLLVGNRLYQISIMTENQWPADSNVKAFMDSFELLND